MIVEPCACGGTIRVRRRDGIERAVRRHNATPTHRAWRIRCGILPRPVGVDLQAVAECNAASAAVNGMAA